MSNKVKEFRVRNVSPGEHKRATIAAAECEVRLSDFCRTAINEFCRRHEKEQAAKRCTKEK